MEAADWDSSNQVRMVFMLRCSMRLLSRTSARISMNAAPMAPAHSNRRQWVRHTEDPT